MLEDADLARFLQILFAAAKRYSQMEELHPSAFHRALRDCLHLFHRGGFDEGIGRLPKRAYRRPEKGEGAQPKKPARLGPPRLISDGVAPLPPHAVLEYRRPALIAPPLRSAPRLQLVALARCARSLSASIFRFSAAYAAHNFTEDETEHLKVVPSRLAHRPGSASPRAPPGAHPPRSSAPSPATTKSFPDLGPAREGA